MQSRDPDRLPLQLSDVQRLRSVPGLRPNAPEQSPAHFEADSHRAAGGANGTAAQGPTEEHQPAHAAAPSRGDVRFVEALSLAELLEDEGTAQARRRVPEEGRRGMQRVQAHLGAFTNSCQTVQDEGLSCTVVQRNPRASPANFQTAGALAAALSNAPRLY